MFNKRSYSRPVKRSYSKQRKTKTFATKARKNMDTTTVTIKHEFTMDPRDHEAGLQFQCQAGFLKKAAERSFHATFDPFEMVMLTPQFSYYRGLWDEFKIQSFNVSLRRNGAAFLNNVLENVDLTQLDGKVTTFIERNADMNEIENRVDTEHSRQFMLNYSSSKTKTVGWKMHSQLCSLNYSPQTVIEKDVWNNTMRRVVDLHAERIALQCAPVLGCVVTVPANYGEDTQVPCALTISAKVTFKGGRVLENAEVPAPPEPDVDEFVRVVMPANQVHQHLVHEEDLATVDQLNKDQIATSMIISKRNFSDAQKAQMQVVNWSVLNAASLPNLVTARGGLTLTKLEPQVVPGQVLKGVDYLDSAYVAAGLDTFSLIEDAPVVALQDYLDTGVPVAAGYDIQTGTYQPGQPGDFVEGLWLCNYDNKEGVTANFRIDKMRDQNQALDSPYGFFKLSNATEITRLDAVEFKRAGIFLFFEAVEPVEIEGVQCRRYYNPIFIVCGDINAGTGSSGSQVIAYDIYEKLKAKVGLQKLYTFIDTTTTPSEFIGGGKGYDLRPWIDYKDIPQSMLGPWVNNKNVIKLMRWDGGRDYCLSEIVNIRTNASGPLGQVNAHIMHRDHAFMAQCDVATTDGSGIVNMPFWDENDALIYRSVPNKQGIVQFAFSPTPPGWVI